MTKPLDHFGLPTVRKGYLRGRVHNIRETTEESPLGSVRIIDFDLLVTPGKPGVPVRMRGIDFLNRLIEGWVMDVPDPNPDVRPITPQRVASPWDDGIEVIAYFPGVPQAPRPGRPKRLAAFVAGSAVAAAAFAAIGWYLGVL